MTPKSKSKNQSKKQKKSQPTVVRLLKGGGCDAPDVVSHYISPPNSNIPAGYGGVESIFRRVFYSPGPAATQSAGGFMVDPAITIGKVPVVHPYAPRAEPVILNGEVHLSCQSQCGSGKISSNKVKGNKMTQRKSKHTTVSKKKLSARKGKKSQRRHRSRTSRSKKQNQRGGKEGEPGNFSPDMMTRDFSGKQPEWNPNTI
jgi:hypothetical protein